MVHLKLGGGPKGRLVWKWDRRQRLQKPARMQPGQARTSFRQWRPGMLHYMSYFIQTLNILPFRVVVLRPSTPDQHPLTISPANFLQQDGPQLIVQTSDGNETGRKRKERKVSLLICLTSSVLCSYWFFCRWFWLEHQRFQGWVHPLHQGTRRATQLVEDYLAPLSL